MTKIINHNLEQMKFNEIGELIKMVKVPKEAYEFAETLKAENYKHGYKEEIVIKSVRQVDTQYGKKFVAVLQDDRQVFLNSFSLQNLVAEFGDDTEKWNDRKVHFICELSERTQGKRTLIVEVPKEEAV